MIFSQLFYGKHSQLVYGLEAEVANVSVGRQVRNANHWNAIVGAHLSGTMTYFVPSTANSRAYQVP